MKISCTQENLNQGLFVVSHLVSKNVTLPILNNILFKVDDNSIKLLATNLEIGVSCEIRGKVEQPGEFTVQSRLLADFIGLLPKTQVDLLASGAADADQVLVVKTKNHTTKIKGQPATDFPVIPQIDKKNPYQVDAAVFHKALNQVLFAVSVSETRPEINGVFFNLSKGVLTLVATDSYRLAEKKVALKKGPDGPDTQVIIPARTLQELTRILGSFKDPAAISEVDVVTIYLTENQILFELGSVELVSRLVEGQYPDYRQIIPQQFKTTAVVDTAEIIKAVKTAGLFTRSGIYDVKIDINSASSEVVVNSTNTQLGENTSKISAVGEGENNSITLNYRYLLDGLQNLSTDQVKIKMIDSGNPCVLQPAGEKTDYLYIVMPIKQ